MITESKSSFKLLALKWYMNYDVQILLIVLANKKQYLFVISLFSIILLTGYIYMFICKLASLRSSCKSGSNFSQLTCSPVVYFSSHPHTSLLSPCLPLVQCVHSIYTRMFNVWADMALLGMQQLNVRSHLSHFSKWKWVYDSWKKEGERHLPFIV